MRKFYANSSATLIIIAAITVVGLVKFASLPVALYPLTSKPSVRVGVNYKSITPKDFLAQYGDDVERALKGIKDMDKITSNYATWGVQYTVEYDWGIDNDEAIQRARNAIDSVASAFPDDWGDPWVYNEEANSSEVIISAYSDKFSANELTELLENTLMPRVESIDGLGSSFMTRFDQRYVLITLKPDMLLQYQVTPQHVQQALAAKSANKNLGEVAKMEIRALIKPQDLPDIEKTVIKTVDGVPLYLTAVGDVELKKIVPDKFYKANGMKALIIGGAPKPDANIKQVCDEFLAVVKEQVQQIDPDIKVDILLNPSKFIREAIDNVLTAVLIGMLIATLIVFMFLRSLRNTVVICISIPLSLIGGVILMDFFGIEINLISLGAMALAVGMVVDGSIVVLENVTRHLESDPPKNFNERLDLVTKAVREVASPVIASLLTTIIVFAPLPFTSPLTSAILGDLAVVMVCVLVISVFVTLLIIPPLMILLRARGGVQKHELGVYFLPRYFGFVFEKLQLLYLRTLERLLKSKLFAASSVAVVAILVLGAGYVMTSEIRREVMAIPDSDKVFLFMNYQNEEFELEESEQLVAEYEQKILTLYGDDLSHILTRVNKRGGWILAFLKEQSQIGELKKGLENTFQNTPLINFYVYPWNPTSLKIPDPPVVKFYVNGASEEERRDLMNEIADTIRGHEKTGRTEFRPGFRKRDFLSLEVDKDQLFRLNHLATNPISEETLYATISLALDEKLIQETEFGGETTEVKFRFPEDLYESPEDLGNIQLRVDDKIIPLKSLVSFQRQSDYSNYYSEDGKSVALVELWPKDTLKTERESVRADLMATLKGNEKIDFRRLSFEDSDAEINANIESLVLALGFALILIAILITLQFGGILQALIIMLAIPFGFIGVSASLWLFESTVSVNSMLGFILLCGTAVNNSILLIDFYNHRLKECNNPTTAILEAARLRFRPILITSMTTILGMLPIALAFGNGGKILQPLGIAICGGLGISTGLTLFFVPLAIRIMESLKRRLSARSWSPAKVSATVLLCSLAAAVPAVDQANAQPAQMSLDQAIEQALANYKSIAISEQAVNQARYGQRGNWTAVLPSIGLERSYKEQEIEVTQEGPTPDQNVKKKFNAKIGVNTLTVEQSLTNPYSWYKDHRLAGTQVDLAETQLASERLNIANQVRVQWYKTVTAAAALDYAAKNLEGTKADYSLNQKRFSRGFLSKPDADRGKVVLATAEANMVSARNQFRKELENLKFLLGMERNNPISIDTALPEGFDFFAMSAEEILKLITADASLTLKQKELALTTAELEHDKSVRSLLPDVSVGVRYQKSDPNTEEFEPQGPEYFAAIKWTLYAGGQTYYQSRQASAAKQAAQLDYDLAKAQFDKDVYQAVRDLETFKANLTAKRDNVKILSAIYEDSRQRFQQGLVSSKVVTDDYTALLQAQNEYLGTINQIAAGVASVSNLAGNPKLFDKLF